MANNRSKEQVQQVPIEKHDSAAWADVESTKPVSNVSIPKEMQTRNAKEWVDTNEK